MNKPRKTPTSSFHYVLPENLIAQRPLPRRDAARMLVLNRKSGQCLITGFSELARFLSAGDCVVFNNTRVIPARMYGEKTGTGAAIELLLLSRSNQQPACWRVLARPGKRLKPGTVIRLKNRDGTLGEHHCVVLTGLEDGSFRVEFDTADIQSVQEHCGEVPLPPYIQRCAEPADRETYQTVYARVPGAVAAPTAGLHFTTATLAGFADRGIKTAEVTLHVGAGTFRPVKTAYIEDHHMHTEEYLVSPAAARAINETRRGGGAVLAVGTTVVRCLETNAASDGTIRAGSGKTDIFIYPPYEFRAVDKLLTNFHLPGSTLLMLVSAFGGRDKVMNAYETAKRENFRFYSYGDCMLIT